jgi:two-component system, cell cycle sensor histidine kinase and response regulator CckA
MNGKPYRILLVDDDIHLLKLGERIIKGLGYNVISHTKSTDALEIFRDLPNQFDLVITDYRMPEMDGAELSKEILKITPDIPIIMCSGFSSDFSEKDANELGINWFIRKPLMKKDFAKLIEEALDLG